MCGCGGMVVLYMSYMSVQATSATTITFVFKTDDGEQRDEPVTSTDAGRGNCQLCAEGQERAAITAIPGKSEK